MEILAAVVPTVLEYTIKPIMRHVSYPFKWKSNVGDLEEKVQALKDAKERLEDEKEIERRNGKELYGNVNEWLNKVDEILEKESEELVQAKEKAKTKRLFGVFPDLKKRYYVSRKAEKKAGDVAKLLQKKFSTIARPAPLPSTEALSTGDYEVLDSRILVLGKIKSALTEVDVRMVGVYGIGGMGKTTLAKEVARQAKEENLFNKVIFVTVTIDVNIEKIQDLIADQLGLKFDEKSVEGRASRLSGRLKQEKKLLLILDDLWQTLDLGAVGIPSSNQHTEYKMLLTFRDLEVLSNGMNCQKDCSFAVDALPENEAWDLFKTMADNNFENDDRYSIYDFTLEEAQDTVFSLLNRLKTLCLLMEGSKNEEIVMHDVVRETGRMIASSNHGVLLIGDDKNMGKLLVDEDRLKDKRAIWIHGKVDEFPQNIQCPDLVLFHINGKYTHVKVSDKLFEGVNKLKVLSLSSFSFSSCPSSLALLENLKILCCHGFTKLKDVSIIGELKKLEVLSFADSKIMELPKEIGQLTKLKLLDLSNCNKLKVIAPNVLSKLSRLEELYMYNSFHNWDVEGQNAASLIELKELASLTTLEVDIDDVKLVRSEVFSNELCRYKIFIGDSWFSKHGYLRYYSYDRYEMSKTLVMDLENTRIIDMGNRIMELMKETEELYLSRLKGVNNFGNELVRDDFPKLKHLHLYNSSEIQYIVEAITLASSLTLPMLESLELKNLDSLVSVEKIYRCVDTMQSFFSKLRIIKVKGCWNIEKIIREEGESTHSVEFPQLQHLTLKWLPKLKSFCCKDLSRSELNLIEAGIREKMPISLFNDKILFPNLKELDLKEINMIEMLWHGQLPPIQRSFQSWTELYINRCDNLKYAFSYSLIECLIQLKYMAISNCPRMKEVIEGCGEEQRIPFPKLQFLRLYNLPKLKRFCKGYLFECPSLKEVEIHLCSNLETFVSLFNERVRFPNSGKLKMK